jgi:ribosomal protein S27E
MYELECPNCHHINEIVSDTPIVEWECENCSSHPVSSLPTDEEGNLI